MNDGRRVRAASVGTLLIAGLLAGSPVEASADPKVDWARGAFVGIEEDPVMVRFGATAGSPIVETKVHVKTRDTGVEIALLTEFDLVSGTATDGVWHSRGRLLIEPGWYDLDVEVRAADGSSDYAARITDVLYWWKPHVEEFSVSRQTIDKDQRTVVVSGRLVAVHPATGAAHPMVDKEMGISALYDSSVPSGSLGVRTRTDSQGLFSAELELEGAASIGAGVDTNWVEKHFFGGTDTPIAVTVNRTPTRVTAAVNDIAVIKGEPVVVSGRVEEYVDGSWQPLSGMPVGPFFEVNPDILTGLPCLTTDTEGRFSLTANPQITGRYRLLNHSHCGGIGTFYAASEATTETVKVTYPASFSYFMARPSQNPSKVGIWDVTGIVHGNGNPEVQIQVRGIGSNVWTTITTVRADMSLNNGRWFSAEIGIYDPCFIRAYVPRSGDFEPAASSEMFVPGSTTPRRDGGVITPPVPRRW